MAQHDDEARGLSDPSSAQEIQRQFALLQDEMKRVMAEQKPAQPATLAATDSADPPPETPAPGALTEDEEAHFERIERGLEGLRRDADRLRETMVESGHDPAAAKAIAALHARTEAIGKSAEEGVKRSEDTAKRMADSAAQLAAALRRSEAALEQVTARLEVLEHRRPSRLLIPVAVVVGAACISAAILLSEPGRTDALREAVETRAHLLMDRIHALVSPSQPHADNNAPATVAPDQTAAIATDQPTAPSAPTQPAITAPNPAPVAAPTAVASAPPNSPPAAAPTATAAPVAAPPVAEAGSPSPAPSTPAPPIVAPASPAPANPAPTTVAASDAPSPATPALSPPAEPKTTTPASTPAPGAAADGTTTTAQASAEATPASASTIASAAAGPTPVGAAPSVPAASEPDQPAPHDHIVLKAKADVWVQVRNRQGGVVLDRILHGGDTWVVPDQPSLTLSTGNAGGLQVLVDGHATPSLGLSGAVRRDIPLDAELLRAGRYSAEAAPRGKPAVTSR